MTDSRADIEKTRASDPAEHPAPAETDGEAETVHQRLSTSLPAGEPTVPMGEDLRDRTLGDYHLLRRLGRGGMAEVYLAEQSSLKRRVAVKVLRKDLLTGQDDSVVQRFRREAEAVAGLNHPNIIQVYSIGEQDGIHYIAQEYVQGLNLREFLSKKGPPDATVAVHIMRQVASALEAAGHAGIVHRDIKPENIMVAAKGKVKVADFGLAQLSRAGERVNLTQVGITMGTPLYMSPEQINGQKLDARSDIYSFGVTCYHMLAGQPPFRGETALSIAVQHLKEAVPPLDKRRPDLPPALCQVVQRMMSKSPDDRYPSAEAVLTDLKMIARTLKEEPEAIAALNLPASAAQKTAAAPHSGGGVRLKQWAASRPLLAFVISCLLVGSASAGMGWLMRPANPLDAPIVEPPTVPKARSAADQYFRAKIDMAGADEDAWRAVGEYWPNDLFWVRSADVQLGLYYFRQGRIKEAERKFDALIALGDSEPRWQAAGYAGKALIESYRGNFGQSQSLIMFEVEPRREHLDQEMSRLIRDTIARNRKALGDQVKKDYEEMFRQEPEVPLEP